MVCSVHRNCVIVDNISREETSSAISDLLLLRHALSSKRLNPAVLIKDASSPLLQFLVRKVGLVREFLSQSCPLLPTDLKERQSRHSKFTRKTAGRFYWTTSAWNDCGFDSSLTSSDKIDWLQCFAKNSCASSTV